MKHRLSLFAGLALVVAPSLAWAQAEPIPELPAAPEPHASPAPASPASATTPARAPIAEAPAADATREAAEDRAPGPPRYDYLRVGLGFRIGYIDDRAFDTFADNDVLGQLSLDASYAFFTRGKLAISGGAAWDVGSRSAGVRGLTTHLTVHRLTVPIEARWYFTPWFAVFGKVAPGVAAFNARVEDPSSPASLEHAPWVFAGDLSAGATFRLAGTNDHAARAARLWVTPELGYGLTSSRGVSPSPNRDAADVLGADERARLGSLAVNGLFWRASVGLTF
jgi:hypothetical protein